MSSVDNSSKTISGSADPSATDRKVGDPKFSDLKVSDPQVTDRMRQLAKLLRDQAHAYYVLDEPLAGDSAYDSLRSELVKLEEAHPELAEQDSPTKSVGGQVLDKFISVAHDVPMLSLSNIFSAADLDVINKSRELVGLPEVTAILPQSRESDTFSKILDVPKY